MTIRTDNRISVVVTTYNNPPFLELVLKALLKQQTFPREIIVADDGSTEETRKLIENFQKNSPVPILHSWIEDKGFRVAKSRNIAVSKAAGDYIILLDGDMVVERHFVEDHASLMQDGQFVTGSRARLSKEATEQHCNKKNPRITLFSKGLTRRLVMLRCPAAHHLIHGHDGLKNARSCHIAFWKKDFVTANGFDERFEGWGYEDSDLVQRFFNMGLRRKNAKLLAPAVHLWHPEKSQNNAERNLKMLETTKTSGIIRAEKGIDQYLG